MTGLRWALIAREWTLPGISICDPFLFVLLFTICVLLNGVDIAKYFYEQWTKLQRFPNDFRYIAMENEGMIVENNWAHKKKGGERRVYIVEGTHNNETPFFLALVL